MLKRFFVAILLCVAADRAAAVDYTDIWFVPEEAGWGANVVQSDVFLFITFFIYGSDGKPTWFVGNVRTQDAGGSFNGPLFSTIGTYYLRPWAGSTGTEVGTVSFQPLNPYTAKLIYTVNGIGTVTKTIQRQPLLAFNKPGVYGGGQTGTYSNCSVATNNGTYHDFFNLQITQAPDPSGVTDGTVTFVFNYTNFACTLSGTIERHGQLYSVPVATYQCPGGINTTATMTEIKATAQGIEGRYSAPSVGGNCREDSQFSAVRG